jgi:large subunit ribosomal protein L36e
MTVIRKVIHEICGHAPYEKKIMELLKQSKANAQKKAYKLAKKSLGNHRRALRKRTELQDAVARHEH